MEKKTYLVFIGFCLVLAFGLTLTLPLCFTTSCTPQARSEADAIAVDLTRAVCSPADPLDANPIVEVVCLIAEGAEAFFPLDAGTDAAVSAIPKAVSLKMRREHVAAFCKAHPPKSEAGVSAEASAP